MQQPRRVRWHLSAKLREILDPPSGVVPGTCADGAHASRALSEYDGDFANPESILHPFPAESGSVMEQGVPVTTLEEALREFSEEDAARLREQLNPPPQ